jgi:hypothetical protein
VLAERQMRARLRVTPSTVTTSAPIVAAHRRRASFAAPLKTGEDMADKQPPDDQISKWRGPGKPSFASSKDEPLATAGTGGSADPKRPGLRPRPENRASVAADTAKPEEPEDATREGPGEAEGRTDNKAGG